MANPRFDQLADELARAAIARIEPDEASIMDIVLAESRRWWRPGGSSLGYGIPEIGTLVAPYVAVAATWVAAIVLDETRQAIEKVMRKQLRRILPDVDTDAVSTQPLPNSHSSEGLQTSTAELLRHLKLDDQQSRLIARVVVTELWQVRAEDSDRRNG